MALFDGKNSGIGSGSDSKNTGPLSNLGNSASHTNLSNGSNGGKNPVRSSVNSSSKLLKDLLESANNFPKPSNSDLGRIHLTLNELQRKSEQLRKRKDVEVNNFTKAHYLLASSGISAEEIENELKSIEVPVKPLDTSISTSSESNNIDSYLEAKKDENILAAIEQSLVSASNDFNKFINDNISIDWKVRRDELRKSIGITSLSYKVGKPSAKKAISWNKSIPGNYKLLAPLSNQVATSSLKNLTREKFENYAQIIYQLNESRINNKSFPLAFTFEELTKSYSDLKSKQISDAWKIIIELTDEKTSRINQEQCFFDTYQSDVPEKEMLHKKQLISKSKGYLEQQFFNYIDEIYTKDNKKVKFVVPTNINKVSYFIDKIIKQNNSDFLEQTLNVNGTPIWALIFYLLRAGLRDDVLELTQQNKALLTKLDKNFPVYLNKYIDSGCVELPIELNERLNLEFNQQFSFINDDLKRSFDPYKYSVYKVIGKCDLGKKKLPDELNLSIEDWLWYHLSIINEFSSNLNSASGLVFENYSLNNLQSKVIQLGPKKLNASSNNPLFLRTLLLVGLYELAVKYAFEQINEYDAVHLAIGLCYYGLLKVSGSENNDELINVNAAGNHEVNFSRLLGSYTRFFKISDPVAASQYLILIALSKGGESSEEISKCHEALRELVLISREFSMIGKLGPTNGNRIPGIIEKQRGLFKLPDISDFYQKIVETSAVRCEEEGRIFDALLLYQLCQEYDTVVSLINKLLGEILSTTDLDQPLINFGNFENIKGEVQSNNTVDNNIILLAQNTMNLFSKNSFILGKITTSKRETCDILLSIINVRDVFLNKNWNQVILKIARLNLIPATPSTSLIDIRKLAERVHNNLDDNLIKVIPSLLIMVMTSVSQLNYTISTKQYQPLSNEKEELKNLKSIAKNCMIYAGIVQYKMPRETYSLLISIESLL